MSAVLIATLEANLAAAAAILVVLLVRNHVHRLLGAGAAYLLWAAIPVAMLATLIPSRTLLVDNPVSALSGELWATALSHGAGIALSVLWAFGAVAMAGLMIRRQREFLHSMQRAEAGPAVVGFVHPRIVTPSDFEQRFTPHEQRLILAHEQVHLERHDTRINALVALARCLFWFNPLVHAGAHALRADQELSCDATVIERRPKARRAYAETLLKTQLAARPLPVGCYWPAGTSHPLTERISMLTRTPFSDYRRLVAATAVIALVAGAGIAAWAAQPVREISGAASGAALAAASEPAEIIVSFEPLAPGARLFDPSGADADDGATPFLRVKLLTETPSVTL